MFLGRSKGNHYVRCLMVFAMSVCSAGFLGGCGWMPLTQADYFGRAGVVTTFADDLATVAVGTLAGLVGLDTIPVAGDAIIAGADRALEDGIVNVYRGYIPSHDAQDED